MLRTRLGWIPAVLAVLSLAPPARADKLTKGTWELEPSAQFFHQSFSISGSSAGSQSTLALLAGIGYCASDLVEVIASPVVTHQSFDDTFSTTTATSFGLLAGVRFNFTTEGSVVPFVGGALGVQKFSGDLGGGNASFILPRIEAGIRLMVGRTAAIVFAGNYQHENTAAGVKDLSSNDFTLSAGVSIFPRRGP